MKKTVFAAFLIVLTAVFTLSIASCSGGGKIVNSAEELKEYLDSLPANSPNKPIKIIMNAKDLVFQEISAAITSSGKYVSLNLSGSPITTIPERAFFDRDEYEGCETLVDITIPDSVTSIKDGAFYGCTSLKSVTIGNSVTSIGDNAFRNCTSLTSVTIPNSVTTIGIAAFINCTSLTSVTIPDSVTSIGIGAFGDCTSLTEINIIFSNTKYSSGKGVLYNKDKTALIAYPAGKTATSFVIPDSITSIGGWAFGGCTSLKSITIPNSVTSIRGGAFSKCTSLTSVTIPDSVESIGNYAFSYCTSLTSVTFQGKITSSNFGDDVFDVDDMEGYLGDLRAKYLDGSIGTYTRPNGESKIWTKQ